MQKPSRPAPRAVRREAPRDAARRRRTLVIWLLPAFFVVLAAVITFAVVHHQQRSTGQQGTSERPPLPEDAARDLTQIPEAVWDAAPPRGVTPLQGIQGARPAQTPPLVLYIGSEYCPYCAALRWSLVAALARFGTFSGLAFSASSATDVFPDTPTLTMLNAHYQSPYLTLQTVELQGNVADASGQYPPLQKPTPEQAALLRRYDPSGSVPFLLIGGRYLLTESPFSPGLLAGMDARGVAASLQLGVTPAAQAILGEANEIAAAVCAVDGGAPASVCGSKGVRGGAQVLPQTGP